MTYLMKVHLVHSHETALNIVIQHWTKIEHWSKLKMLLDVVLPSAHQWCSLTIIKNSSELTKFILNEIQHLSMSCLVQFIAPDANICNAWFFWNPNATHIEIGAFTPPHSITIPENIRTLSVRISDHLFSRCPFFLVSCKKLTSLSSVPLITGHPSQTPCICHVLNHLTYTPTSQVRY
ncbi:hypothetical protein ID866_12490 [Astraeus odoratus]|nr:hypothetical protein ID866_12490 [Astraeus odoratus]